MLDVLAQICPWVAVVIWVGGAFLLAFRARARQIVYLRQFPPVNGIPLDALRGDNLFDEWTRARNEALREPQIDGDLERLRQEVRRRSLSIPLWIFGFPLGVLGGVAILILIGILRL